MILLLVLLFVAVKSATPPASTTIRFQFDYEEIKSDISGISMSSLTRIVEGVASHITQYTKVYKQTFTIPPGATCSGSAVASNISATYSDIDLLVVVSAKANQAFKGLGTACYYDSSYIYRPVLGKLVLSKEM